MLRALELVGFKSFADKTRFEFPRGITVVVGPNGSGKSNIVDAIKWVLGEQSVKSLRGKEMADIIFNGSGTRRAMNSAEITLTFDNTNNLLPIDTPEVHITRRVYRSGEGEYLVNRHPGRLRDIRDLLSGTGMGTHAYSVIEQGKVDVLLQSSPRDRRVIFEEAAGISRFKAKKIESLRRLDRVQQNLLRLSDIVDEVESRLRSVRLQAGKARRYKEYTDRLQELRTQAALVDWRRLSERLAKFEDELQALAEQSAGTNAEAETIETRLLETDTQIGDANEAIRQSEGRIAENRERIAGHESTIEHERNRSRDLEQEIARHRRQLVAMTVRAGDLQRQLLDTVEAVRQAEEQHRRIAARLAEGERQLTGVITDLDQFRGENEQRRHAYMEQMRAAATLGNQIGALESELAAAAAVQERSQRRIAELDGQCDALAAELEGLRRQRQDVSRQVGEEEELLAAAKDQLDRYRRHHASRQEELARLRQRQSGAAERAAVLEELQRRQEGLSAGVKEVLAAAANATGESPLRSIRGLVADLLHVGVEIAPLVEVALGQAAQHVVAAPGTPLLDYLKSESQRFAGRVGFVWLENQPAAHAAPAIDLEGRSGVLGRADRFVKTDPRFVALAHQLLGRTWFVEKLDDALALAEPVGRGLTFVTLAGERLAADGTLIVGPRHAATGLISRRSQLEALKTQLHELENEVAQTQKSVAALGQQIEQQQQQVEVRSAEHRRAADALAEHGFKIAAAEQTRVQLDRQRSVLQAELRAAVTQHDTAAQSLDDARAKRQQAETHLGEAEAQLSGLDEKIDRLEDRQQVHNRETTETKVELAKSEERLRNLHARMRQFEESRQERSRAIADAGEQLARCTGRAAQSRRSILRAESQVAELYLCKEKFAAETVELIDRREWLRRQRTELTADAQTIRARIRKIEEKIHAADLAASEVRHERGNLADRFREDYGIELAELEGEPSDEEQHQREEVQQEIDELRRKIGNLGNVNIEALDELDDLETRHKTLADQYRDLAGAKASLERIIDKINTDSRRLFSETLETVTGHFRELFRDLFGGGHADIILDEGVDILESGIEIVARPPGKEPRSISLLSGGEKTLTCVALLLAIFRSRPSPFCVLDEVDAALDEANIDRFTQVLKDFLTWTQFIIVTHSKKTMTCADTIYGVTMQESGVSKQVSVRFEDVSDDGEILPERLAEEDETQAA
ncbi:MAG TPA: chromosome segregation protein SMC [Thermoguttaceae bacterium]|nr:chromosome segregation protein SMC [Thermoguttaceae bacterium]